MKLVIIESPYAGNVKGNVDYARQCIADSLMRGESPIASHLLYTQEGILKDEHEHERRLGIDAGLAWHSVADAVVFYLDRGMSKGMKEAVNKAIDEQYRRQKGKEKPLQVLYRHLL